MNLRKVAVFCFLTAVFAGISAAQDRILQPVDRDRMAAMKGHVNPRAVADNDQGPVDPAMPIRHATLLFKPAPAIGAFLAEQQLPGSPNYRKWLTPEEFGDRFGLTMSDIAKVTAWLESQGLKVDKVARGRHWINFSGTAGQAARTFRTRFHRYRVNGETHFANVDEPSIPAAFEELVGGFLGLDDFKLRSNIVRPQYTSIKGVHTLVPDDLATIYNIAPLYAAGIDGEGQRIAIVGDSSLDLSDLRAFRKQFNLPFNDPIQILVGDDPGYNDDVVESNLDIEWANAVARGAQIVYVYSQDVRDAAQFAVDENVAPVLSMSFGSCEAYNLSSFRAIAQQASAQGITWLASSGDTGAAECDRISAIPQAAKGLSVGFPASIPEITSVGGTQFDDANGKYWAATNSPSGASALGYIPETVWNDTPLVNGFSGGGGGASILFPKPYWQTGPGVPDDKARDVPDISLSASAEHVGYQVFVYGDLYSVGGTSASAPSLAGVVALLNQHLSKSVLTKPGLGNINPTLYRLAQSSNNIFHDVTNGDNAVRCALGTPNCVEGFVGYRAGPGYDQATGLGSIDAYNLVTQWNLGTASTTTVIADPGKAGMDDTVRLTATVRGGTAGVAPTGVVSFLAENVVLAQVGVADLTPNGATSTAALTVPAASVIGGNGVVTAMYNGDKSFNASSATVTVGVNRPASGSLVVPYITPSPVYKQAPFGDWPYTLMLTEKAGVQTTLTAFTVNSINNLGAFGTGTIVIPAKGTLAVALAGNNLTVPIDRVFHFAGKDLDGTAWSRDVTVPFLDAIYSGASTGMSLRSAPATVLQNPKAEPACQFTHRLIVQETGGFLMQITALRQGTTDLSASLQQLFGTTHLAPFGTLQGDICLNSATSLGAKTYTITGISSELGNTVTATFSVTLAAASAAPAAMTVAPQTVTLAVADAFRSAATDVALNFTGGAPKWTASVLPGAPWLSVVLFDPTTAVSPPNILRIVVNAAGLSRGAYRGVVAVQSDDAIPQAINIPVTFVVGTTDSTVITAVANGASYTQAFAPGVLMTVFGTGLAPVTRSANSLPLPLDIAGVSATVNGVSAPLYYISPGQINVQVPYETGTGLAILGVNNNGQVASFPFTVGPAAPGLFTAPDGTLAPSGTARQGQTAVAFITGEGDTTTFLVTGASPPSGTATSRLPRPRLPVTVTVGGLAATVSFAGTPVGLAGVSQVNFIVPAATPLGLHPVVVSVGGVRTQTGRLNVTQ